MAISISLLLASAGPVLIRAVHASMSRPNVQTAVVRADRIDRSAIPGTALIVAAEIPALVITPDGKRPIGVVDFVS